MANAFLVTNTFNQPSGSVGTLQALATSTALVCAPLDADQADAQALLHMTFVVGGRMMLFEGDQATIEKRWLIGERFLVPAPPAPAMPAATAAFVADVGPGLDEELG